MGRFGLLLILVALFIQGIKAASVNVNEGKLSEVDQLEALASIAGQSYGDALLEMLNGTDGYWHPMAFWRFLILGAPPNKESFDLTKENNLLRNVSKMEGLSATKKSAVALYQSTQHVKEVGTVNIKAWSLVYSCFSDTTDTSQCAALVPVFILYSQYNKSTPEYVNLYRGLFTGSKSTYFATAVSADLAKLQNYNDTKDVITFQMPDNLEKCTLSSIQAARSVLAASYGLPGFVCYNASSLTNVEGKRVLSNEHALDSNTTYDGSVGWSKVPIEDCSAAPFLYGYYGRSGDYHIMACAKNSSGSFNCVTITSNDIYKQCNAKETIDAMYEKVMKNSTSTTCGVENSVIEGVSGYTTVTSGWETSDGKDEKEFELGQPTGDFCYIPIGTTQASEPISCSDTNSQTSARCNPTYFSADLLEAMLKDTADNFLSGHVSEANIKNGPYGSRLDAAALAVATFMGLVGMIGPLTLAELKLVKEFKRLNSSDEAGRKPTTSRTKIWGCLCLCMLNVCIGCAAYGPIIAAMYSQYQKRERFHTWAISVTSETVNSYGTKLLFLTFVEGSSTYFSLLIWSFYILACALALIITAFVTFYLSYSHARAPITEDATAPILVTPTEDAKTEGC